jgi:predicted RNA-binding Zn-ribbon protein involved in translation (DUF1610 family)
MLKVDEEWIRRVEKQYPGIRQNIDSFESADLPSCPRCGSVNTAVVSVGIVGRSIHVAAATNKMRLLPDGHPAEFYCNECGHYLD